MTHASPEFNKIQEPLRLNLELFRIIFVNFRRIIVAKKCDCSLRAHRGTLSAFHTPFAMNGLPVFDHDVRDGTVRLAGAASDTFFQIDFYHDDPPEKY